MAYYMYCPLDLTVRQQHIYTLLFKKSNFKDNYKVEYTIEQLTVDSDVCFGLTEKMVRTTVKQLIEKNYLMEIIKGKKGIPTTYQMCVDYITSGNLLVTNRSPIGNLSVTNDEPVQTVLGDKGNLLVTNRSPIGNEKVNPIIKKEDEEIKNVCVFDYWQSKKIHVHKELSDAIKKQIEKLTKKQAEEVIGAIDNYSTAYFDTNYYYNNKWTLDTFIKQSNGYSQWTEEGKLWIDYESKRVKTDQQSLFKPGMTLEEKLLANAYRER